MTTPTTHEYDTRPVLGKDLDGTMVLVGESGGLSAIYDASPSDLCFGMTVVNTEHGPLYLDPDSEYAVLAAWNSLEES